MEVLREFRRLTTVTVLAVSSVALGSAIEADAAPEPCAVIYDADCDGLSNAVDKRVLTADNGDVDGDGIINLIDVLPYTKDAADADKDGIINRLDQQPYVPVGKKPIVIAAPTCGTSTTDSDCDGIQNKADRYPYKPDLPDADYDGKVNARDSFPYVPFVDTTISGLLAGNPNYCYTYYDNDCDGITDSIDVDDFISDYPDVDIDGLANKNDAYPFYNKNSEVVSVPEPSKRFNLPLNYNQATGLYTLSSVNDLYSRDDDGDGLANAFDPYRYTYDWDNDGRPDGKDSQISVNQDKVEEKRLDDKRIEKKQLEKKQEQQRIEEKRERERQDQQRLDQKTEQKRLDEKRLQDQRDQQRRDEQRRQQQRDEQRRQDQQRNNP